ncbi:MAG: smalltalk protein [Bacteroidales bacterium]|nr:smalltalk protein [Bacteroidales bacterium]
MKKETWKFILQTLAAILTAIATTPRSRKLHVIAPSPALPREGGGKTVGWDCNRL